MVDLRHVYDMIVYIYVYIYIYIVYIICNRVYMYISIYICICIHTCHTYVYTEEGGWARHGCHTFMLYAVYRCISWTYYMCIHHGCVQTYILYVHIHTHMSLLQLVCYTHWKLMRKGHRCHMFRSSAIYIYIYMSRTM